MKRRHLYAVAGIIWGIPGITITLKGIKAYMMQPSGNIWWLLLVTISVMAAFFMMFRRITGRYIGRIASLPERVRIWQTFPLKGWILLAFMMGLGIGLKHIPGVPSAFTASFYSGLGPMLILSSLRFIGFFLRFAVQNR